MDKFKALESLINITNCNIGYIPSTPAEFNNLGSLIHKKTQYTISTSSIKRLWGYVNYGNFPSRTTLNILAKFNDFKDWDTFLNEISFDDSNSDSSSAFMDNSLLNANYLNIGDVIILKWGGRKQCTLEYISYLRFKVLDSRNIKLEPGDTCTLHSVCIGLPLFISNIQRKGVIVPAYIGAKKRGIRTIDYIKKEVPTEETDIDITEKDDPEQQGNEK